MGRVTANKMEVVTSGSNHQAVGMAVSVCTTPAAPSPIPVPYPTMAPPKSPQRKVKDAPMRTKVNGKEVLTVGAVINGCIGNEPGTLKEVVSLNNSGPCFPLMGSPTVITEAAVVARRPPLRTSRLPAPDLAAAAADPPEAPVAAVAAAAAAGQAAATAETDRLEGSPRKRRISRPAKGTPPSSAQRARSWPPRSTKRRAPA